MTFLGRFILATLVGLVLAAGVHIAVIFAAPYFAEQDAFGKIHATVSGDHAQVVSPPGGGETWLRMPDPATAIAACAFDLQEGPMRIATKTGSQFLSFSFHTKLGGVFFAITDRAAIRGEIEIVVMTARQLDEARAAEDEEAPSRDVRIVAPEPKGFALVRVAAPMPSQRAEAEAIAKAVTCTTGGST